MTNGQGVAEAVEDIVVRGVSELRKSAFGDDVDDAKSLAWSREQAWAVLKLLAKKPEVRLPSYPSSFVVRSLTMLLLDV